MFTKSETPIYRETIEGTHGRFSTFAGTVAYIQTKARLGTRTNENESRLTARLCPVREVLDMKKMNFNQLLQRDLDDHRVSASLLEYLLNPLPTGPAFFPPILAAILPFRSGLPSNSFPDCESMGCVPDATYKDMLFLEERYGSAYRVQLMAGEDKTPSAISFGRLSWNEDMARLVVLDGQHRAMALLAIDRTINNEWKDHPAGLRYQPFYERRVQELLPKMSADEIAEKLKCVEFPVTVCWFPDYHGEGEGKDPHMAARKLFVDVNKNARAPSAARLTLLSDSELINVLARSLLNEIRERSENGIPLYAVEYDNPDDKGSGDLSRWSVFTNLHILKSCVRTLVFGPEGILEVDSGARRGRLPEREMDAFMREQLGVSKLFKKTFVDGDRHIERSSIGNRHFPVQSLSEQKKLVDSFVKSWGQGIVAVLGTLKPYADHISALNELESSWIPTDSYGELAREAVFDGLGMFWTLRDTNDDWLAFKSQVKGKMVAEPQVIRAWRSLQREEQEFKLLRAKSYLGKTSAEAVEEANDLYRAVNTHACQLGALLTVATIRRCDQCKEIPLAEVAGAVVHAWNAALTSGPSSRNRLLVFSKGPKRALNMLPKMDSTFSVYFRYFWLELLATSEGKEHLSAFGSDLSWIDALRDRARSFYLRRLEKEAFGMLRTTKREWKVDKCQKEANFLARRDLSNALKYWFGIETADFTSWCSTFHDPPGNDDVDEEDDALLADEGTLADDISDDDDLSAETQDINAIVKLAMADSEGL